MNTLASDGHRDGMAVDHAWSALGGHIDAQPKQHLPKPVLRTMARLESQEVATCHRATLYRIAATLADDPEPMFLALAVAGVPGPREQPMPSTEQTASWICGRVFAARPEQTAEVRAFLGRVLHGCPMAYDAKVVCSELFTNSVLHSRSARPGGKVTVRAEVREHEYVWLEVEDQGGTWANCSQDDESGRGLEVVAALSDYWDIRARDPRRTACARLDWPDHQTSDGH